MTGTLSPTIPTLGDPNATEDPDVRSALVTLRDGINAVLTSGNKLDGAQLGSATVPNSALTNASIALAKLANGASGQLIVVNSSGVPVYRDVTGDVTFNNTGGTTIGDGKVGSRQFTPVIGVKTQSAGTLALTGAFQDVPNTSLSITPAVASNLLVTASFHFSIIAAGNNTNSTATGVITVDGSDQTPTVGLSATVGKNTGLNTTDVEATVARGFMIPLTAAAHTIKLRAQQPAGGDTCGCDNASFTYLLVSQ